MADASDVLLELWKEQREQARQTETQRAALTNIVILVFAAGLGFVIQKGLSPPMLTVTVPIALLGAYGAIACMKFHERSALHARQALHLRAKLAHLHPQLEIETGWADTYRSQGARFPRLTKLRLYALWVSLHMGIAVAGCVLSICALL
ncbi:hypothetical protein [Streptomyces umbrinus]|uniref:hypothetical protein n=1 Tax=Streptomyces umbrinus TaxID=67370 RepID=UPI0033CE2BF9